jgi:hypothetical protein
MCLGKSEGISADLKGAGYYFKLAADQGIVGGRSSTSLQTHCQSMRC